MQLSNFFKFTDKVQLQSQVIAQDSVGKSLDYEIVCPSGHKIKQGIAILAKNKQNLNQT